MKILIWLLKLFGFADYAAGLEAVLAKRQEQVEVQVQEIKTHEEQIDEEAEAAKIDVGGMSEPELDERLRR